MGYALPNGYQSRDADRFLHEDPKSATRSPFQRDRARVLHSSALRRLGAKTQVLGAGANDFARTRLTHSLEVSQVGRDLANVLGADPDVVEAACLSHDLGHPPFGHNGESVLNQLAEDIGGFEGNAQTLRLLSRLEPKVFHYGRSVGLNLTRASLDAAIKYPWRRGKGPNPESMKFGVYEDDQEIFNWAREGAPVDIPCFEAQIMDASDDIAYSVHDIEDAITLGRMQLSLLEEEMERGAALYMVQDWYLPDVSIERLDAALARLERLPYWVKTYHATLSSAAALKNMCSQLIGRFTQAVADATQARYGYEPLSRYGAEVVIPEETYLEISVLKGIAATYVMSSAAQRPVYENQATVLTELHEIISETGPQHMDPLFAELYYHASSDQERARVVIDQIASFTDITAIRVHEKLKRIEREQGVL